MGTLAAGGVPSLALLRRLLFPITAGITTQYSPKEAGESSGGAQHAADCCDIGENRVARECQPRE